MQLRWTNWAVSALPVFWRNTGDVLLQSALLLPPRACPSFHQCGVLGGPPRPWNLFIKDHYPGYQLLWLLEVQAAETRHSWKHFYKGGGVMTLGRSGVTWRLANSSPSLLSKVGKVIHIPGTVCDRTINIPHCPEHPQCWPWWWWRHHTWTTGPYAA